jgi:hypothetical protein
MKSTLKKESKGREIAKWQGMSALGTAYRIFWCGGCSWIGRACNRAGVSGDDSLSWRGLSGEWWANIGFLGDDVRQEDGS